MNTLYAIYGKSNSGKTSTIKHIDDVLATKYKLKIEVIGSLRKDIFHILYNNSYKIGIISQGDVGDWLEDYLEILNNRKCNIIVCATHTRGKTCIAVEKYATKYNIIWEEIEYYENKTKNFIKLKTVDRIIKSISDEIG